jgi:hypothetical protein
MMSWRSNSIFSSGVALAHVSTRFDLSSSTDYDLLGATLSNARSSASGSSSIPILRAVSTKRSNCFGSSGLRFLVCSAAACLVAGLRGMTHLTALPSASNRRSFQAPYPRLLFPRHLGHQVPWWSRLNPVAESRATAKIPSPTIRRVLIPRRVFHPPFCLSCLKPITTQAAMYLHNRLQASWRSQGASVAVEAQSDHPRISDNPAAEETMLQGQVPSPVRVDGNGESAAEQIHPNSSELPLIEHGK